MNEERTALATPTAPARGMRRLSSRQRWVIAGVAFAFGLLCYFLDPLGQLERALVFIPRSTSVGDWHPAGVVFEDAWFQAADGTKLHGWFLPHEKPRAVVVFCHGNEGNVALWRANFGLLHDLAGVAVLGFDYRGYGRSEGSPSEAGIFADARAARAWLAHRTGIPESQIVLLGRSLGGAVAIDLAAKDGARALVVESTFTSAPELAGSIVPWLPLRYLMRTELNSIAKIKNYHGPFLQSHGDEDRLVPYAMGQRLFAAANEPKRFVTIPHGGHNDPQSEGYFAALREFLDRL